MQSPPQLLLFAFILTAFESLALAKVITPEIDSFINKLLSDWHVRSGISIAVVSRSENGSWETETAGYGAADLSNTTITGQTQFALGSNSKHFDAIGTGIVISNTSVNPRISWDTPIKQIFSNWKLMDSNATDLATITDLMSHQTGLPRHDAAYNLSLTKDETLQILPNFKPSAPFRTLCQYNNFMYSVLSFIPEQLVGTPLTRYLQAELFDKLGMNSTTYSTKRASQSGKFAKGIGLVANEMIDIFGSNATAWEIPSFDPNSDLDGDVISGPGGLISTADDLNVWIQMLLLNGSHPITNETIVPADVLAKLATPIIKLDGQIFPKNNYTSDIYYGGGRGMFQYRGEDVQEHDGDAPGMQSAMATLPNRQFGVTVMSNAQNNGGALAQIIKFRLMDAAMGLDPIDWTSIYVQLMQAAAAASSQAPTPPSNITLPSTSFEQLQGKYADPAYGVIELCYVPPNSSASSTSEKCNETLAKTNPAIIVTPMHKYVVARDDAPFDTHWILSHWNGDLFNLSDVFFEPIPNATSKDKAKYWLMSADTFAVAVFDPAADGFGIAGGFWGGGASVIEPNGSSVKDKSEVWFTSQSSHVASASQNSASSHLASWLLWTFQTPFLCFLLLRY